MQKLSFYSLLIGLSFLFISLTNFSLSAQCTINVIDGEANIIGIPPNTSIRATQSFTACQDGLISSLTLNLGGTFTEEFDLYIGTFTGSQLTSSPVATTSSDGVSNLITFNLNTPFPVVNDGTIYTFEVAIKSNFGWIVSLTSPSDYPNGNAFSFVNSDLDFQIEIIPAIDPVPTMSQWGLIVFGLLIMNLGLVLIKRKEELLV